MVLEEWPSESIDTVYIDPPFGTGSAKQTPSGKRYRDPLTCPDTFVGWLSPRLEHSRRCLKSTGSLFLHLDYRSVHYAKVALDRIFGRNRFINEIVWCYSVGGKSRRSFGKKHDTILWYAKRGDYSFFPDQVRVARKPASHMRVRMTPDGPVQEKTDRKTGRVYQYPIAAGKLPEDWWTDIETLNHSDRERIGWPTQKPVRLLERLLAATTERGGSVADWFCGSGTTAIAAQKHGFRFVAVDQSADAIACARERLELQGRELAASGSPPPDVELYTVDFLDEATA